MIFISYAKEDYSYAQAMYIALKSQGLSPWMDKPPVPFKGEGLLVGQRWQSVLQTKLNDADYIILVLSPHSVAKRGYVQVEFRTALDRMNYLPDEGVLVFPVLTEECAVPSLSAGKINLKDLQWDVVKNNEISEFATSLADRVREVA